jgi:hypothetical protein
MMTATARLVTTFGKEPAAESFAHVPVGYESKFAFPAPHSRLKLTYRGICLNPLEVLQEIRDRDLLPGFFPTVMPDRLEEKS